MASKFLLLLILAVAVRESSGIVVDTTDCGSDLGKFSDFQMDCDEGSTAALCMISDSKSYSGSMKVTPNTIINNGTISLHAIIGGTSLPFPFPDNDLCKDHSVSCPMKPNVEVVVSLSITVPSYAPKLNIIAKIELTSNSEDLVCLEFLASIH